MQFVRLFPITLMLIVLLSPLLRAEEPPADTEQERSVQRIWLNAGFLSYHPDRSRGFREQNWGFGAQLDLDDEWALMGGQFLNSENQRSHYLAAAWQPLKLGPFDLGLAVGAMDGYPRMSNGDWFLAALPLLSWRGDHLAVNVTGTPKIRDKIDAMIAIQLMWRVW